MAAEANNSHERVVRKIGRGCTIDRVDELFEIGEELGRGGFGRVCRAKEHDGDVEIALKIIPKNAQKDGLLEKFGAALLLQAVTVLRHPNLIEYRSFAEDGESIYAAMELCMGGDLLDYISERAPLPGGEALPLAAQIFNVLDYMHTLGGIHRDIKPDNFMFSDRDRTVLKLVDMGTFADSKTPRAAEIVGTVGFSAPEVFEGGSCFASDLFSAAVITSMLLTGGWPSFMAPEEWYDLEDEESLQAYKKAVQKLDPFRIRDWAESVGFGTSTEMFAKMLDPNPNHRPTAGEARDHPWLFDGQVVFAPQPILLKKTFSNIQNLHGIPTKELVPRSSSDSRVETTGRAQAEASGDTSRYPEAPTSGACATSAAFEFRPGQRVKLTSLQARQDLNGTIGILTTFDSAKLRWGVKIPIEGSKSLKAANLTAIGEDVPTPTEVSDVWMQRLRAATEADRLWSAEHAISNQKALPSKCRGAVDFVMWHIRQNLCGSNQELAQYVVESMAAVTQAPEKKDQLRLDECSSNARVANFLKAFRDAV